MNQWSTLFKKEMLQRFRNFQWIWLPIAFFILGAMDPILNYFLPDILEMSGDEAVNLLAAMPEMTAEMALAGSVSEFALIGVMIVALMNMGMIAAERKSGVIEMVLVKPVGYWHYISSKFVASVLMAIAGLLVGFASAAFYTTILFETPDWSKLWLAFMLLAIWYALLIAWTLFLNTLLSSAGAIGAIVVGFAFLSSLLGSMLRSVVEWNPGLLTNYASEVVQGAESSTSLWGSVGLSLLLITTLLFAGWSIFSKREPLLSNN